MNNHSFRRVVLCVAHRPKMHRWCNLEAVFKLWKSES